MSKTNFKCMYLVDDRLYKTILEVKPTQNQKINTNTSLTKNFVSIPSQVQDEIYTSTSLPNPTKVNQPTLPTTVHEIPPPANVVPSNQSHEQSSQRTTESFATNIPKNDVTHPHHQVISDPSVDTMDVDEQPCDCENKRMVDDTTNKALQTDFKYLGKQHKVENNTIDDEESEEIRDRFKKIKYDINYQPPKH